VITLVGGTMFLMWLGEQITSRGIGNGISLIIFAGIVAGLPSAIVRRSSWVVRGAGNRHHPGSHHPGHRRDRVHRVHGARAAPSADPVSEAPDGEPHVRGQHLVPAAQAEHSWCYPADLCIVTAFGSRHNFRLQCGGGNEWLTTITALLGHGQPLFMVFYAAMIIFFCFFYTAIVFNPSDTADNLKKHGGFIPGIRPGERTAQYIDFVLTRITVVGAIYITIVCLLPEFLISATGVPFYFGGTSLLIVVSVTMDTVSQIQGHLLAHQYEGLVKKSKLRGKRR
jgi:preprotein translocase subunit SecY